MIAGAHTRIKEIPNTNLLVSLHHHPATSANLAIYDISQKEAKKIYAFEEVFGGKY